MARPPAYAPLDIYLNGRPVGQLRRQASGAIDFLYDQRWLGWEHAIPVSLSLPLREQRFIGEPVIAVFENLLPDDEDMRRTMATRVNAPGSDIYSLLSAVGRDCIGALQFLPEGQAPGPAGAVSGRAVGDKAIARILKELHGAPLGLDEEGEFRISLAGVQEKTALLWWKGKWHVPHDATATTHIIKPAIKERRGGLDLTDSVENEYLCMKLTAALGLPVATVAMQNFAGEKALVVERFDRLWTKDGRLLRIPQEDCCQALSVPPAHKYELEGPGMIQILEMLRTSDEPEEDQKLFLKAQVAYWLLGATDGHGKNFSLRLMPGGRFRLAPLYDVMSTQPYLDKGALRRNQMKVAMAAGNKRHKIVSEIMPRHFEQTAKAAGVAPVLVTAIFDELAQTVDQAAEQTLKELPRGFPKELAASITDGLRRRARLLPAVMEKAS